MTNEEIKALLVDFYSKVDEDTCSLFDLNMKNAVLDSEGNLKNWISEKTFGIALYSMFNAIKKTREAEEKRIRAEKLNALHSEDTYFGEVGYKFKGHPLKVTLTRIASYETDFGTTYVWNMVDEEGHTIVWKTSTTPYYELQLLCRYCTDEYYDYCHEAYENTINYCEENHSDDEKIREFKNEIDRLKKLMDSVDNNIPVSFNIVGGSVKEHKEYTNREGVTIKQTMVTRCKVDGWSI